MQAIRNLLSNVAYAVAMDYKAIRRQVRAATREVVAGFAPITVCADWGPKSGTVDVHKAWSKREALAWVACYPLAVVTVYNRVGKPIAWRF